MADPGHTCTDIASLHAPKLGEDGMTSFVNEDAVNRARSSWNIEIQCSLASNVCATTSLYLSIYLSIYLSSYLSVYR